MVRGHAFSWRAPDGGVRTTVVGKVSMALGVPGTPFVAAEPIVHFDRIAADRRFVDEVGELMPWSTAASVVVRGGPLRVEIHGASGARTIEVKEGAPVGISMASEGRARLARTPLSRGDDGLLSIAPGTDARYFSAAPPWQGIEPLAGNERFVIERGGQRLTVGPLPGVALVADVSLAGHPRRVVLGIDLVVVDAVKSRLSFVARAVLSGFAEIRDMRMTTRGETGTADTGDPPPPSMTGARAKDRLSGTMMMPEGTAQVARSPQVPVPSPVPSGAPQGFVGRAPAPTGPALPDFDEEPTSAIPEPATPSKRRAPAHLGSTAPVSPVLLARVAMPFAGGPKRSESRPDLPATPFDRGFAPTQPTPAANVGRTVSGPAYPDMTLPIDSASVAQQLRERAHIGGAQAGASPPADPRGGAAGSPEEAWSAAADPSAHPGSSHDDSPRVAAPRKGAMAKPRPRKR